MQRARSGRLGILTHSAEQHRLAHAVQPRYQRALGWPAQSQPSSRHSHLLTQRVTSSQFQRRDARSGSEGISDGVHVPRMAKLVKLSKFRNFTNFAILQMDL